MIKFFLELGTMHIILKSIFIVNLYVIKGIV